MSAIQKISSPSTDVAGPPGAISPPSSRCVLITGGLGFLGLAVARGFKARGDRVVGLGHGEATTALSQGYDRWLQADVSSAALATLDERFDVVVHCAGRSSVAWSIEHPLEAFEATVGSTAELLDHLRRGNPDALVIQASSAAVYGAAEDRPLRVGDRPNPVSPYGFHKEMTEGLLRSHASAFGQRCIAVRFFSIYGPGLRRQLLWDAATKLSAGHEEAVFWGTGQETRDWIHVDDAARLVIRLADAPHDLHLLNGASGVRSTVAQTLEQLRAALGSTTRLRFNGQVKAGDPLHYHADMAEADRLGWQPAISLEDGLRDFAQWFKDIA